MKSLAYLFLLSFFFIACSQSATGPSINDNEKSSNSGASSSSDDSDFSSSSIASSADSDDILAQIYEAVNEDGKYTSRDSVAAYLCKFNNLPSNYVGKNDGISLYEATGKSFSKWNFNPWKVIGVMIGGDKFNNFASDPNYYHPNLPEGKYLEADVDYNGDNRGTKRLVYQDDCVIYYTADHYGTFSLMEF